MQLVDAKLGFSTADAEDVGFHLLDRKLVLRFTDWRGRNVVHTFQETLAVRWAATPTVETPRDDTAYRVVGSTWPLEEAKADGREATGLVHYVLCFNASGVLEIICE